MPIKDPNIPGHRRLLLDTKLQIGNTLPADKHDYPAEYLSMLDSDAGKKSLVQKCC